MGFAKVLFHRRRSCLVWASARMCVFVFSCVCARVCVCSARVAMNNSQHIDVAYFRFNWTEPLNGKQFNWTQLILIDAKVGCGDVGCLPIHWNGSENRNELTEIRNNWANPSNNSCPYRSIVAHLYKLWRECIFCQIPEKTKKRERFDWSGLKDWFVIGYSI